MVFTLNTEPPVDSTEQRSPWEERSLLPSRQMAPPAAEYTPVTPPVPMLTNFCCAAAGSGAANARATAAQAAASPRVVFFLPKVCLTDLLIQTPFEDFPREYAGRSGDRCARGGARCLWRRDCA